MANPQTFNDDQLNEIAREVFYKSMTKLRGILDGTDQGTSERIHALAAAADAAACGFKDSDDEEEEY